MVKDKNIVLFMFLLLFVTVLVPTVSAIEWDNYYVYDEQTNTAIIRNGLTFGSTIAEVTRITPQNYEVAPGYQYVLELSIVGNVDYNDFVTSLDFHDKKNAMAHFNRDYDLKKYDGMELVDVDTYGCLVSHYTENNTLICDEGGVNGTVQEWAEKWTKLTPADMKKDEQLIIRVYTEVEAMESVEWYMDLMGSGKNTGYGTKGVKEWANWQSSLDTNLVAYYEMEASSGNQPTEFNSTIMDLVSSGSAGTYQDTGIIDFGMTGDGTVPTFSTQTDFLYEQADFSFSGWFNITDYSVHNGLFVVEGASKVTFIVDVTGVIRMNLDYGTNDVLDSTDAITLNQWTHIVFVRDKTVNNELKLYVNGALNNSMTDGNAADGFTTNANDLFIGTYQVGFGHIDGTMDEIILYDRVLTPAEIIVLYGGGSPPRYQDYGSNPPTAELGTPTNETEYNTNSLSVDFTCKGIDAVNLDNLTFSIWNMSTGGLLSSSTNTDGQNDTLETFSYTVTGGTNYSWNCLATNNNSESASATNNNTVFVYTIPDNAPNVTLNSPPNNTVFTSSPVSLMFNCSAYDDVNLVNVSLIINGAINVTNSSGVNDTNYLFSTSAFNDGSYTWTCRATDNQSQQTTPTARTFTVDGNAPEVTITAPANGTVITQFNQTFNFNWTVTDSTLDTCWYTFGSTLEVSLPASSSTRYYDFDNDGLDDISFINLVFGGNYIKVDDFGGSGLSDNSSSILDCDSVSYDVGGGSGNAKQWAVGDYFCVNDTNGDKYLMMMNSGNAPDGIQIDFTWSNFSSSEFFNLTKTIVTCGDNTTVLNYPTTNPDSLDIFLYANDSVSNIGGDNVTILKSTDSPDITITSPVSNYATLLGGQVIDLNFTISNVTVLDDCFYNYNGINNSLNCVTGNQTNFTYVGGIDTLTVFANDTLNNINSSTVTWTAETIEINYTFDSPVVEGSSTTIDLYTIVNGTINSANLFYNGTAYPANIIEQGGGVTKVTSTFQVPDFPVDTNATFLMSLGLVSGSTANFTTQTQLVQTLEIGNCTAFSFLILNLSLFDEKTLLNLEGTIEADIIILDNTATVELDRVSTAFYNTSNALVCSNIALNSSGNLYSLELRYYVDPTNTSTFLYVPEFYHIQQGETNSLPQTINLYNLNVNQSTEFSILYRDNNYISRPNVLLQIERKYVSEGIFRTVEIPITSSEGSTTGHFDLNNYKYRITATQYGEVLNVFDNPAIICESELAGQCTLSLNGKGNPNPYNSINEVNGIAYITTVNGSQVTVTYTIPSGETKTVRVVMQQDSAFAATTTICNQTLTSSSGSITCTVDETIGDSQVLIEVSSGGFLDRAVAFFEESISDDYNLNQYIIGAFLLMILVTMFVSSPKIMVSVSVFGVALLGLLFLLNGSSIGIVVGVISWLIIAGIIILVKISKKDET